MTRWPSRNVKSYLRGKGEIGTKQPHLCLQSILIKAECRFQTWSELTFRWKSILRPEIWRPNFPPQAFVIIPLIWQNFIHLLIIYNLHLGFVNVWYINSKFTHWLSIFSKVQANFSSKADLNHSRIKFHDWQTNFWEVFFFFFCLYCNLRVIFKLLLIKNI